MATLETRPPGLRPDTATPLRIPQAASARSHCSMIREPPPARGNAAPGGVSARAILDTMTLNGAEDPPGALTDAGAVQTAVIGAPLQLNEIGWLKPPVGLIVTMYV